MSSLDPKLVASIQPACEYSAKDLKVTWKIKKLPGGIEAGNDSSSNSSSSSYGSFSSYGSCTSTTGIVVVVYYE